MRISSNWLKDYIDIDIPTEKLAGLLTMAGLTVEAIVKKRDDSILEIEVTSNRPDWLSYIGVARELSALTGKKLKIPVVRHCEGTECPKQSLRTGLLRRAEFTPNLYGSGPSSQRRITVKIEDKKLCPRYTARIIQNVRVGESPSWLKAKLEMMGLRPVNNIVDITNLCLFETGEPMHAFDLDKISGSEIIIRHAKKEEKIFTIDGAERKLDDSRLVIADSNRPIAIAGVMGGVNTEVTTATKNILLEAAFFDPVSIRRTSRLLGISTESSYRFERKVDLANIKYSSDRALSLILDLAGGQSGKFYDIGLKAEKVKSIRLRYSKLNSVLGLDIPPAKVKKIVSSLGMKIISSSKEAVKLDSPGFRYDLKGEIDVIEEVLRIYGYGNIPKTIPNIVETLSRESIDKIVEKKIRYTLAALGLDEIITYSLLSKNLLKMAAIADDAVVGIKNPLSGEQEVMRPGMMAGMLNAILWNMNRKTKDLWLFEMGRVYRKEAKDKYSEKRHLSIGIAGDISNWLEGTRAVTAFDLKGVVETLLAGLGIKNAAFKNTKIENYSLASCAEILIAGESVGVMSEVAQKVLGNFDIKARIYSCEICVDSILKYVSLEKRYHELAKFPSVFRDISIIAGKEISNASLTESVKNTAGPILKEINLIDRYTGKQIPDGKIGLTYRLEFYSPAKTLEEKDVSETNSRILGALQEKFGAKLR